MLHRKSRSLGRQLSVLAGDAFIELRQTAVAARRDDRGGMVCLFIASWSACAPVLTALLSVEESPLAIELGPRVAQLSRQEMIASLELFGFHWPLTRLLNAHNRELFLNAFDASDDKLVDAVVDFYCGVISASPERVLLFHQFGDDYAMPEPDGSKYFLALYQALADVLGVPTDGALIGSLMLLDGLSATEHAFNAALREESNDALRRSRGL